MINCVKSIFKRLQPCSHEFKGIDIKPRDSQGVVKWSCCKCGKEFHAECGLDILEHGKCIGQWSK